MEQHLFVFLAVACYCRLVSCVELTFELEDNARECFHENIVNKTKCTLEFQVVTGGHYDVDLSVKDPHGKVLYDEKKKQYDSVNFDADILGEYEFCFSNEFSSFSHKTIYMDFNDGTKEPPLPIRGGRGMDEGEYVFCFSNEFSSVSHKTVYFDFNHGNENSLAPAGIGSHHTALTQIETSSVQIHESLNVIIDYQTHHRLREAASRDNAEYLNERVQYWSIGQAVIILTASLVQVFVLKNFFAEKRDRI